MEKNGFSLQGKYIRNPMHRIGIEKNALKGQHITNPTATPWEKIIKI